MAVASLTTDVLYQTMEGFGTHLNADESLRDPALLAAYRDAGFSMVRLEVTPGLYTANRSGDLTIPVPIEADYDGVVRIDDLGDVRPGVYWTYDGVTFTPGFPPADPEEIKP